jgi:signal peptidase I
MKTWLRDNRHVLVFLALFGVLRTAVADWNPVPSGSMRPTVIEGDVVLVNRLAYALKLPLTDVELVRTGELQRGDVVTLSSPVDGTRLLKRLVAVGGDVVAMHGGRLVVNGEVAPYDAVERVEAEPLAPGFEVPALRMDEHLGASTRRVQWLPSRPSMRDVDPVTVPPDHVMVMGDNRDNSLDSRAWGFVPRHLLIGRAHHVLVSGSMWPPTVRIDRFGMALSRTAAR